MKKITQSSKVNIHCMYCRQGRGISFKAFAQTSYSLKKKYAGLYKVLLAEKLKKNQFIKSHKTSVFLKMEQFQP